MLLHCNGTETMLRDVNIWSGRMVTVAKSHDESCLWLRYEGSTADVSYLWYWGPESVTDPLGEVHDAVKTFTGQICEWDFARLLLDRFANEISQDFY